MNEKISISKTALGNLINAFLPRDDDPGPWGPLGPVIRDRLLWILLNPQPLPPKAGPQPDPWHLSPHPQPWRSVALVRLAIGQAVLQYQLAEVMVGTEQLQRSIEVAESLILRFVDEFCGTKPPRLPWPWPPKFDPKELYPLDFLVAGAEFQRAIETMNDETLEKIFAMAADQMFEMGLKRMENKCGENATG